MTDVQTPKLEVAPESLAPMGHHLSCSLSKGSASIVSSFPREDVAVFVTAPRIDGQRIRKPEDLSGEARWFESLARRSLSAFAARRLGEQQTINIAGKNCRARRVTTSDILYIDLGDWATAYGLNLKPGVDQDNWSFKRDGRDYDVYLGTDKIKVGNTWTSMPDVAMLVGGRPYVPRQAL
jgi:hypothetical protein